MSSMTVILILLRSAVLILDHCDSRLALEHGPKLGPAWMCANKTEVAPGTEASCSNIFSSLPHPPRPHRASTARSSAR